MKLVTVSVDVPRDGEEVYGGDAVTAGSDHG
jgi:hypothetical protein